jgi:hypothetical protein
MDIRSNCALAFALAIFADISGVTSLRPLPALTPAYPQAAMPLPAAKDIPAPPTAAADAPHGSAKSSIPLQPQSQLLLVRYVDGEFAKLVQPLPGGKKGFTIKVGTPIDQRSLGDALRLGGTSANPGDRIQITALEFRSQTIVVRINGGGKKHFRLRDHLQIGVGAGGGVATTTSAPAYPEAPVGGTFILDYGRPLPDMSPDDLKRDLSVVLDFSKEHSAAINWVESLPPPIQEAIKDHRALVGMDQEMVVAAMGRPSKKVRERDANGQETEDWIYGTPPAKTTFVTFVGDNVIRVKEFE